MFLVFSCASPLFSQISTKTGTIYGKVLDSQSIALPGVNVTLESEIISTRSSITGPGGAFRFANLPPGEYSAIFHIPGFMDIKQEGIHVSTGASVDLRIIMKPAVAEQMEVFSKSSLLNSQEAGTGSVYSQVELNQIPNGRDPWALISQTPGVVSDRFNTGSQQGQQSVFYARGGGFSDNIWNYDGVNESEGGSNTYYDFGAFEEIQISTGGSDASIQTGGVVINLVTKRAGNQWHADLSGYFADEILQSKNTPQELIDNPIFSPITGMPAVGSNRINQLQEYGFNAGGPIVKDKLFLWGGYRKYHIDLFTVEDVPNNTTLTDYNAKVNFNWNKDNEAQIGYFKGLKDVDGRAEIPGAQAPETLWVQDNTPIQGIFTAQNTWIPNDQFLLTARYGYIGSGFTLIPAGGNNVPIIYLSAIPLYESTYRVLNPSEQRAQDINADANYFKEELLGGDHEFKFGFEYKNTSAHSLSSYGNGVYIYDHYQTTPGGPLTSGYLIAQHFVDGKAKNSRVSFYATDTYRRDRLTLNLGLRFDHQSGKNLASSVPAIPGFENDVGAFVYPGGDPGIAFNNLSPRLGAAFDLDGNGKTVLRGNFARYYSHFDTSLISFSNPTFSYNGASYSYVNKNGDRNITPDEITGGPNFYGGLGAGGFDLDAFLATKKYDPDLSNSWTNEFILGIERELSPNLSLAASYIYRRYGNFTSINPFGVDTSDYAPAGVYTANTVLGDFNVPYFTLDFIQDGTGIATNIKDYYQSYQGMEFILKKRMSSNFLLNGSFVLQKQTAHYQGGDSLGFVLGRQFAFDPTNLPFLNDRPYAYFGGKTAVFPNSNWSLKVSGVYQFPWDLQAGAYVRYQQGFPFILQARVPDSTFSKFDGSDIHFFFVEPYGSRRLDNVFSLDINVQKGFDMQKYGRLTLIMDVFNVTNADTVLGRIGNLRTANLNQITEVLSPRAVRLGLNYNF